MGAFNWGASDEVFAGRFGAKEIVGGIDHGALGWLVLDFISGGKKQNPRRQDQGIASPRPLYSWGPQRPHTPCTRGQWRQY